MNSPELEELKAAAAYAIEAMQNMRQGTFRGATARLRSALAAFEPPAPKSTLCDDHCAYPHCDCPPAPSRVDSPAPCSVCNEVHPAGQCSGRTPYGGVCG